MVGAISIFGVAGLLLGPFLVTLSALLLSDKSKMAFALSDFRRRRSVFSDLDSAKGSAPDTIKAPEVRMKILIALAVCFGLSVFAKDRSPAQITPYPTLPGSPSPTPATGSFNTEDVLSNAAAGVQSVICLVNGSQPYTISTAYGNDIRVARVASSGAISYEIYKGQKFLGACPAVHVLSH